ncbi:hypothetical protein J7T55_004761 [Diaporthe amygdali]|uniref:uncharacterized protein n=1 Tax=Phomopsis amygdali TaxID=1214568 RepID=UPI0022FDFB44|nr:uncharacterized protein J7T55_004761 [Diaporthe amygdali]KAJ0114518.1 hypothetical protein J7T55_004761 [Diaporthe amygdali]
MAQRTILPLLAVSASSVFAQSTTGSSASSSVVDIILPMLESQTIMGSVMGADATATTFFLTCPTDAPSLQCGLGKGMEVVEGSEVLEVHMTQANVVTADISCSIASNTASCTSSIASIDLTISNTATAYSMVTTTGTGTMADISSHTMPVTITAGLEKLTTTTAATATSQPSSSVVTAGMPRMTQNAVLAGAAMMLGGAMVL